MITRADHPRRFKNHAAQFNGNATIPDTLGELLSQVHVEHCLLTRSNLLAVSMADVCFAIETNPALLPSNSRLQLATHAYDRDRLATG